MEHRFRLKKTSFKFEQIKLIGIGCLIGALVGLIVSLFRILIEKYLKTLIYLYSESQKNIFLLLLILLAMICFAVLVGFVMKHDPNVQGLMDNKQRNELAKNTNWFALLIRNFFINVITVGSGLFVGHGKPSIQMGSLIGQGVSELTTMNDVEKKVLISAGATAGMSAAFNAPIAAVLFIVEEVWHSFSPLVWITSFTAALVASGISIDIFGVIPILHLPDVPNIEPKNYIWLVIFGLLMGLFARIYQINIINVVHLYKKVKIPRWLTGIIPFTWIVPIAYFWPNVIGGGNNIVLSLGTINFTIPTLIALFLIRYVVSILSSGACLPGGIILPVLSLGALQGLIYADILYSFGFIAKENILLFVICGMSSYFGGIIKAPLTSIILITELVGDLHQLMPLGIVTLLAYIVVDFLGGNSAYQSLSDKLLSSNFMDEKQSIKEKSIINIAITETSNIIGKTIGEIELTDDAIITSLQRNGIEYVAKNTLRIEKNDVLVIMTDKAKKAEVENELKKLRIIENK